MPPSLRHKLAKQWVSSWRRDVALPTQFCYCGPSEGNQTIAATSFSVEVNISYNDPKLKNEKLLLVTVVSKADAKMTSMQVGIKRLSEEDGKNISKEFDVLMAENGEETPLNKIIQATFFEQNDLLLDAITNYEAAIKMAPDVEEYKTMYTEFLVRNNLN